MDSIKIALIGTGNLAWHFVHATRASSVEWTGVWSRKKEHLVAFSDEFNIKPLGSPEEIDSNTDLVVVAIADDAIAEIDSIIPKRFSVIHTAGAVAVDVLQRPSRGVLWTLQTLRKNQSAVLSNAPFFMECSDEQIAKKVTRFLNSFHATAYASTSASRAKIHLAAVFANNFSNHLYTLAHSLLKEENIPFHILLPILTAQIEKLKTMDSTEIQTGPAFRNDQSTINKHLELLKTSEELRAVYICLTDAILKYYHDKKL